MKLFLLGALCAAWYSHNVEYKKKPPTAKALLKVNTTSLLLSNNA